MLICEGDRDFDTAKGQGTPVQNIIFTMIVDPSLEGLFSVNFYITLIFHYFYYYFTTR